MSGIKKAGVLSLYIFAALLAAAFLAVYAVAAPTVSAQAVLTQLEALSANDISPNWAPDILARRDKVEAMLQAYLALPATDQTSIAEEQTAMINAYFDGFCSATKTDKAAYTKKYGAAGASETLAEKKPTGQPPTSQEEKQAEKTPDTGAVAETEKSVQEEQAPILSGSSGEALSSVPPEAEVEKPVTTQIDAQTEELSLDEILLQRPLQKKSPLDRPLNDIIAIAITALAVLAVGSMVCCTLHYRRKNVLAARRLAVQKETSAGLPPYRFKVVRRSYAKPARPIIPAEPAEARQEPAAAELEPAAPEPIETKPEPIQQKEPEAPPKKKQMAVPKNIPAHKKTNKKKKSKHKKA